MTKNKERGREEAMRKSEIIIIVIVTVVLIFIAIVNVTIKT